MMNNAFSVPWMTLVVSGRVQGLACVQARPGWSLIVWGVDGWGAAKHSLDTAVVAVGARMASGGSGRQRAAADGHMDAPRCRRSPLLVQPARRGVATGALAALHRVLLRRRPLCVPSHP